MNVLLFGNNFKKGACFNLFKCNFNFAGKLIWIILSLDMYSIMFSAFYFTESYNTTRDREKKVSVE